MIPVMKCGNKIILQAQYPKTAKEGLLKGWVPAKGVSESESEHGNNPKDEAILPFADRIQMQKATINVVSSSRCQ